MTLRPRLHFRILPILLFALAAATAGAVAQTNLLVNGDFETGSLGPWFKLPAGSPGVVAVESCCANQTPGGTWDGYIQPNGQLVELVQAVAVVPGRTYRLAATVSTNGMTANLQWSSNVTGDNVCASTSVLWPAVVRLQCNITVPAGTTSFNVNLAGTAAKRWAVSDDWTLVDISPCSYLLSPTSASFGAGAGTGSVSVTTQAGCAWTAASDSSWISFTGGASGTGSGTVSYAVGTNLGTAPRSGTLTIAGSAFPIQQAAAAAASYESLALSAAQASYVDVPNSPTVNVTGPFTVEAWVNPNQPTSAGGQAIVERYNWLGVDDGGFALRLTAAGTVLFGIVRQANVYNLVVGATALPSGWHHVAGVYDGSQLRIYLDGRLDGMAGTSLQPAAGTATLRIGARGDDAGITFDGELDEVRLSTGVLYPANFSPLPHLAAKAGVTLGLWKFDGFTLQDFSGNSNDGNAVDGGAFSPDYPEYHALKLPAGNGSYVNVPSNSSIDLTSPFTVEASVKPEMSTSTGGQAIVERYNWLSTDDGGFALRLTASGTVLFGIVRQANVYNLVVGATVIPPGWHHVAGVYDGSQLRVFLDGQLDGTAGTSLQPAAGTASLKIGVRGNDLGIPFAGEIDEVRLTASPLYGVKFIPDRHPAAVAGTRGLWRFDNTTAQDASGNGNHGTLVNGASFVLDVP